MASAHSDVTRPSLHLSGAEARRAALGALGFGQRKPARAGIAHVRATAARLGAIQIDSVNVLARAHYLPTFSRYGQYRTSALDALAHTHRELFEYWGHAACFLPMDLYPLMRWRMANQREGWASLSRKQRAFIDSVHREVTERGPLSAGELSNGHPGGKVVAGLRPENFEDASIVGDDLKRDRGILIEAEVDLVESLGSDLYAYFHIESEKVESEQLADLVGDSLDETGAASLREGEEQVIARLDASSGIRRGEKAELWADTTRLHLFDPDSGESLR